MEVWDDDKPGSLNLEDHELQGVAMFTMAELMTANSTKLRKVKGLSSSFSIIVFVFWYHFIQSRFALSSVRQAHTSHILNDLLSIVPLVLSFFFSVLMMLVPLLL